MNREPGSDQRPPLLDMDVALARILSHVTPLESTEEVASESALGRILARAVVSSVDVPPLANSQMDGYAVRAAECESGVTRFPVSARIAAGEVPGPLKPGSVARIFTGAPLPAGADAVVMQESCRLDATIGEVTIEARPSVGEWVRDQGEDLRIGQVVLPSGTRLRAQELGLAAAAGCARLHVCRRLRVALLSTGDELVLPGEPLPPGAIYNSNRSTLYGLLQSLGCEVRDLGNVEDDLTRTREILRTAAEGVDCVISSGGVSVGEEDHVRAALAAEGQVNFWQIAVKPGKPLAFGTLGEALFFGLPGNPVSSFVTFLLFVRPALLRLQGVLDIAPVRLMARADFSWPRPDRRREFLRVRFNDAGGLELFPNQGSGVLTSAVWADGLVDNPGGRSIVPGDQVAYLPFSGLLR